MIHPNMVSSSTSCNQSSQMQYIPVEASEVFSCQKQCGEFSVEVKLSVHTLLEFQ